MPPYDKLSFWTFGAALTEAHHQAQRRSQSMYVYAIPSPDVGLTDTRYGVSGQEYVPGTLPVARVDAYVGGAQHAYTEAPTYAGG